MSTCLSPVRRPAVNQIAGKIQSSHLQRLAVMYARQSTLQQVEHHRESTRLQYALFAWGNEPSASSTRA
jgi:hypothetical protein